MTATARRKVCKNFWSDRPLSHKERQLRDEVVQWIIPKLTASGRPIFMLSLTCQQAKPNAFGGLTWLTPELLWEALEVYLRRIDRLVYRNAARRFQKGIERFVVIEGGGTTGKRLHVHMLVVAPPAGYMEPFKFVSSMLTTWRSSPWSRHDRQEERDAHWQPVPDVDVAVSYVLKTGVDAVAWGSSRL